MRMDEQAEYMVCVEEKFPGAAEDASSKLVDPGLSLRKKVTATNPNGSSLKRARSGLPSFETAGKKKLPLKNVKEESASARQVVQTIQKENMPFSESEKLGVSLLIRRFDDTIANVPIKKRKFNLICSPSPPRSPSPEHAPPRSPSPEHAEVRTPYIEVSTLETSHAQLNGDGQQHPSYNFDSAEASWQEFGGMNHNGTQSNERSIEGIPRTFINYPKTAGSNPDFSGMSILVAAACTSDYGNGADDIEDFAPRAQSAESESLCLWYDMEMDSIDRHQDREVVIESEIQEKERNEQLHMTPKPDLPLALEEEHMEEEKHFFSGKAEGSDISSDYVGRPLELGLRSNYSKGSGILNLASDTNTTGSTPVREKEKQVFLSLNSSCLRDDRSHWDLNTVMDKWESSPEDQRSDPEQTKISVRAVNKKTELSYGVHKDISAYQNGHELKLSKYPLIFEKCTNPGISLGLNLDTVLSHQPNHVDDLTICESLTSNASSDGPGAVNTPNLSIATEGFSDSVNGVCSIRESGKWLKTSTTNKDLETHLEEQNGICPDMLIKEVDTSCKAQTGIELLKYPVEVYNEISDEENNCDYKTEASFSPKNDLALVKDHIEAINGHIEAINGLEAQEGDSGPESAHDTVDNESNVCVSSTLAEKCPVELSDTSDATMFCKVDHTVEATDRSSYKFDATVPLVDTVCKDDATIPLLVRKDDATIPLGDSFSKFDKPGVEICRVDNLLSVDESDSPVETDLNVCRVGAPVVSAENFGKVYYHIAHNESTNKVDVPATVNESICIGSDPMLVDESVGKVDSLETADESGKTEFPVAVNDIFCNGKKIEADIQNVYRVHYSVVFDESVSKLNAAELLVDRCVDNDRSKSMEAMMEETSEGKATEVASACDYDYEEYDEDEEQVYKTEEVDKEHADDDSQYEDGEYREDMAEDLDAERVDYGYSDCRDVDDLVTYDDRFSMSFHVESKHTDQDHLDIEGIDEHERIMDYEQQDSAGNTLFNSHKQGSSKTNPIASELSEVEDIPEHKDNFKSLKLLGQNNQKVMEVEQQNHLDQCEPGELRDAWCPSSSKQKSSGWDQLPEGFVNAETALKSVGDKSVKQSQGAGWAVASGRDSLGWIGSMVARQMERARPSDSLHGRDGVYHQESRDNSYGSSPRFSSRGSGRGLGRGPGRGRNSGTNGSLYGMHGRGRSDLWMEPPSGQWGSGRHHSPGYYGSPVRFGTLAHANAAAASAAKVKSSGFFVAPDGTIVKAGSTGPPVRGAMRPVIGVGRSGRGTMMGRGSSSADEGNMLYGMQMGMRPVRDTNASPDRGIKLGRNRSEFGLDDVVPTRRGGPERYGRGSMGDGRLDSQRRSMQTADYRMTKRDRSLTPPLRRRSPPLRRGSPPNTSCSQTKSHSRSRTCSPPIWSSPRGRAFNGMERGSGSRRRSRSPNIRSEARLERIESPPSHRVGTTSHTMSLLPSSRRQFSPSQPSKWSSRDTEHVRDHDYKRQCVPSRSPPGRSSPRSDRKYSLMDSPARSKHSEYSKHMHSGRLDGFGSDSRRSRCEENHDVRWKNYRYGKSVDVGNNVRRIRDEEEDSLRICSSRSKEASEFQGKGSPRVDDKDRDERAGIASHRERSREEDKTHLNYSRDGRHRGSFRTLGAHEIDDDVAPRRRRPS